MHTNFICPKCRGYLNVAENIVLTAKPQHGPAGLVFLSPKLGDYRSLTHPTFAAQKGEHVDFFCPICQANLVATEVSSDLARIIMVDDDKCEYEILFSEITGEKCTYKIQDKHVEQFGESSHHYMNFFGEVPSY